MDRNALGRNRDVECHLAKGGYLSRAETKEVEFFDELIHNKLEAGSNTTNYIAQ